MFAKLRSALGPASESSGPPARLGGYEPIGPDGHGDGDGHDHSTGDDEVDAAQGQHTVDLEADRRGVYWAFWILGAGVLLAWNVLICTIPLLSSFFPPESDMRSSLASWVSSVYCFGNLFFLGLAQRDAGKLSPSRALHASLLLLLTLSIPFAFPLLPYVLPTLPPSILFPLLVIFTLLLSLSTAILQWAVFALASLWSSTSVLAVMSGQGGIAVLVSGVQVFLAVFSALGTNSTPGDGGGGGAEGETPAQSTLAGVGLWAIGAVGALACIRAHGYLVRCHAYTAVIQPVLARRAEEMGLGAESKRREREVLKRVFRRNGLLEVAVAWVFVVTLSVFPPVTSRILSTSTLPGRLLQPSVFIPAHFFIFNVGDYIGRTYLSSFPSLLPVSHPRVLLLSLLRTLFIPVFLACNVSPRMAGTTPLVNSDVLYFIILLTFGLTNGWISSISMILASSPALNPRISEEEKDLAGTLAAFCLVAGLAGGSICSFGVNWLVAGNTLG